MNKNVDILRFKVKDKYWNELGWKGSNDFIKVKDVTGDSKRIREYTNIQEAFTIDFYNVYKLWKEGKIDVMEGNINELE